MSEIVKQADVEVLCVHGVFEQHAAAGDCDDATTH